MKRIITLFVTLAALAAQSQPAQAAQSGPTKSMICGFTEPFFTLDIDLAKKKVTMIEPDWENDATQERSKVVAEGIQIESDLSDPFLPKHTIKNKEGQVIAELKMDFQGSDGMSPIIYPFTINYTDQNFKDYVLWGGCETEHAKSHNPDDF